jgi:uncharacterized coiled-coil protein SlyX
VESGLQSHAAPPKREIQSLSWFNQRMSQSQLEKIESHLSHLERQYEQLNQVVIEQGRIIAKLQKENAKVSTAVQTMELDRIRANNTKPPHFQ